MREYHKIETVFERDTFGSKKLIPGVYRNETVAFLANNHWLFTEKIDGTNIRVCWDGHQITFRGRTDKAEIPKHLLAKLTEIFLNDATEQLFEQIFGEKEVILFGEGYGTKVQKCGDQYRSDVGFILFDVLIGDIYLARRSASLYNVESIAKMFGLEIVPVVLVGTIDDAINFVKSEPDSTIGTAKMEGVVGHPYVEVCDRLGKRVIVKIKVRDFKEG